MSIKKIKKGVAFAERMAEQVSAFEKIKNEDLEDQYMILIARKTDEGTAVTGLTHCSSPMFMEVMSKFLRHNLMDKVEGGHVCPVHGIVH